MKASRVVLAVMISMLWVGTAAAATTGAPHRRAKPFRANPEDASQRIDINNISMVVKNTGSFAYDTNAGAAGLEFPKGTGKTAVFAAGLWMGALVGPDVRVSVAEYTDDYRPGQAVGGTPDNPDLAEYKVYKLNRVYKDAAGNIDAATRDAILADYTAGAVPHGAPPVTVLPDGSLSITGDQMLWSVYNDLSKGADHNGASSRVPLGIEVQQTTFAFSRQGALGNTAFTKYKIINRGAATLTNAYVSQWADPDLGGFTDDLVGCDTTLSVGFVYNATNNDEQYGSQTPSVGFDFLQGPKVGAAVLGLASFNKYINGGGPTDSVQTYNYMKGLNGDGSPLIYNGQPTNFNVSGDPVTGSGFLDTAPSDRRLMLSSGPFTMAPGDSQEIVVGIVIGQSSSRLASVSLMKFYDSSVQAAYNANFNLQPPPDNPVVRATPSHGSVLLSWDSSSENYNQPPYVWEGYNIYQGASLSGPFTRIATYDVINGVTIVLDDDFNEQQGLILPTGKAFGQDSGLQYSFNLLQDYVRGGPLHDGTPYYFAVTAYATGGVSPNKVNEANFDVKTVVPQTPAAGYDVGSAKISKITGSQIAAGPPASTDKVTGTIVDPTALVSASWLVGFKPSGPTTTWYLVRTVGTTVDTVLNNQTNISGDDNYQIINGLQVRVKSIPAGEFFAEYQDVFGGHPAALGGVQRGLPFFGGGAGYAAGDIGGTIPDTTPPITAEIRFTGGPPGQKAYRYLRGGGVYQYQDYVDVPFVVWDVTNNQQLNAGFLENSGSPSQDGQWLPGTNPADGDREFVWVMASPYSARTPDPFYTDPLNGNVLDGTLDLFYELASYRLSASSVIDAGDKFAFVVSVPSTPNDQFTFTTTAANSFNASLAKGEMGSIRAVPNPYFSHSAYELNRFNRVIKFTHLPATCKIRIFNLAGDLVRTIDKNDNTSQVSWDLNTQSGLPVGSGVYIFHVDAPGVGNTTGKVAIFMEKERLNNF